MITFKRRSRHADGPVDELEPTGSEPSTYPDGTSEAPGGDKSAEADRDLSPAAGDTPVDSDTAGGRVPRRPVRWTRMVGYVLLPALAMAVAGAAGYAKWRDGSLRDLQSARVESVAAATQIATRLLSYQPDTVERDLGAARDDLTGQFRDSYTSLTHDVVIPGAKQRHISAVATVPAAASVSTSQNRATVLLYINQSIIIGSDAPASTASTVKVTLDKVGARWLISSFDPI
jgi:Mce-associated membrane protein